MIIFFRFLQLIVGAGLLAWGAGRFIDASSRIATHFKVSRLLIGILLVGFGTSFPEWVVSTIAAVHHKPEIAIGNVVGSNIANIAFVLGLAVLIAPINVNSRLIKREFPVLIVVSLLVGLLMWNGILSQWDGVILLLALVLQLTWLIRSMPSEHDPIVEELQSIEPKPVPIQKAWLGWFLGLVLLLLGSECLVDAAVDIAEWLGMSELVIGLTIVTLGTSLPELAATVVSARRNEHDIAIGHIVGSNIFNLLAVLAMPALLAPGALNPQVVSRDYPIMLGLTLVLWLATFVFPRKAYLGRPIGFLLLLSYGVYVSYLLGAFAHF